MISFYILCNDYDLSKIFYRFIKFYFSIFELFCNILFLNLEINVVYV